MTHSLCVTWLIRYVSRDLFICAGTTHTRVRHDSCMFVAWLIHTQDISNLFASHDSITGWRRLIGSPKLQVIFHKRTTKYRSLLRKTTYKDKGSYESSPPCTHETWRIHPRDMLLHALVFFWSKTKPKERVSHMDGSCLTYEWDASHIY